MAPSRSGSFWSGTTSSGSKYSFMPSPSQAGQAPYGLLNENSRGSISSMVKPETGQANLAENDGALAAVGVLGDDEPSASDSAVSRQSARRFAEVRPHHDAVDHHLDVVLQLLVERRGRVDLVELAVDLDALEAALLQVCSSLRYSPLRPRTIGASR